MSTGDRVLLAGSLALFFIFTPVGIHYVNYDAAWLLYCAERLLQGAELYVDLFETTPPVATWINLPPALAGELTGANPIHLFPLWVLALCLLSLAVAWRILGHAVSGEGSLRFYLLLLTAGALTVLPAWQFGQREHLFYTLFLPLVMAVDARARDAALPAGLAVGAGALAAVGMSIKPFFLLPWMTMEGYLLWARGRCAGEEDRSRPGRPGETFPGEHDEPGTPAPTTRLRSLVRPETMTAAGGLLLLAGLALALEPRYLELLRRRVLPLYPHFLELSLPRLLTRPPALVALAALSFVPVVRVRERWRPTVRVLAALVAGCLGVYLIQGKGFPYQGYPALASGVMLLGLGVATARELERFVARLDGIALAGIAAALFLSYAGAQLLRPRSAVLGTRLDPGVFGQLLDATDGHVEDRPVAAFSFRMFPGFPLVNYADARWGMRFPNLWPLASVLHLEMERREQGAGLLEPSGTRDLRRWLLRSLRDDLSRSRPVLLLVDERPVLGPSGFDFMTRLRRDPGLERLLRGYRRGERIGHVRLYWRRGHGPGTTARGRLRPGDGPGLAAHALPEMSP